MAGSNQSLASTSTTAAAELMEGRSRANTVSSVGSSTRTPSVPPRAVASLGTSTLSGGRAAEPAASTPESAEQSVANSLYGLQCNQVFLGLVAMQEQPLPDVTSLINDMTTAGIRFVFFSTEDDIQSEAFAQKMGLETGWNCFISLNDDAIEDELGYVENKAHLPRGISKIRSHLERVDDVPLLVPLFSGSSPQASAEMIQIMQEHGKVVVVCGSSLNPTNYAALSRANMSIAIHPLLDHQ